MADEDKTPATETDAETPADVGFEVEDERLSKALKRYDRTRAGAPGAEFGHDQTYRPGYHQGGVRFGFFHDHDKPDGDKPKPPEDEPGGEG